MTTAVVPRILSLVRGPVGWWVLLLVVGLATRPPIPIDETRYLGVAWEMWNRGDLLVPYLLGEPYHHKPPLLFWGMHLGWWLFGVSEWWARLVAPLFALATLVLSARTAMWWWPERPRVALLVPWLLVGTLFWSVFATLTMFDMLVAACALAGALGLAMAAMQGQRRGFLLTGVAIGVGILAKGPVILLHVLPLALAAPWWAALPRARWWRWYAGCLAALGCGGGLALCWAIPAALSGGSEYAHAIFWNQSAGRIVGAAEGELNPHRHGWWWFLPFLPAVLFPWAVWPPAWRVLRQLPTLTHEPAVRWCLCWCGSAFLLHSLASGKQPHYLIPLVAPAMLLLARAMSDLDTPVTRRDQWPVIGVLALICLVLLIGPLLDQPTLALISLGNGEAAPQEWGAAVGLVPGVLVLILTMVFAALPTATPLHAVQRVTVCGILLLVIVHLGVSQAMRPAYDLEPVARRIGDWQARGIAVARVNPYRGEYQFLGRLKAQPTILQLTDLVDWTRQHPDGMVLMTFNPRRALLRGIAPPAEDLPHRGVRLGLWQASQLIIEVEDD